MVRVKTSSGWKTVAPGTSFGRVSTPKSSGFSDPYGQTKATPDHQAPKSGGQSIPSSGGSSGRSKSYSPTPPGVTGYEVIRDGQGMSTTQLQPGDIPTKTIVAPRKIAPAKEKPDTDIKQVGGTAGTTTAFQKKYIESLKASPDANLTVDVYRGVQLPYGQRDVTAYRPVFGTLSGYDPSPTGFEKISKIKDLRVQEVINPDISVPGEVLVRREAEKASKEIGEELFKKYQSRVDIGLVSVDEAQEQFQAEAEEQFKTRWEKVAASEDFSKRLQASEQFRESFKESFSPEFKAQRKKERALFALDVAAITASTVQPQIGIAYYGAKGAVLAGKGASKDIRMGEYTSDGELFVPRYAGLIPSKESQEAGFSFALAGAYGVGSAFKLGSDITKLRYTELADSPWSVTDKQLARVGDTTYLKISGSKGLGKASAEGTATFPIKMGKDGSFKILSGGRGRVEYRVVDFMKGIQGYGKDAIKTGSIDYGLVGRGTTKGSFLRAGGLRLSPTESKLFATRGEGFVFPDALQEISVKSTTKTSKFWSAFTRDSGFIITKKPTIDIRAKYIGDKTSEILFGGVAKKEGAKVTFISGELQRGRAYLGSGRITGLFKRTAFGENFIKQVPKADIGFKAGGAKSSPAFLKMLDAPTRTQSLVAPIIKETPKVISKTKIVPTIVGKQFAASTFVSAEKTLLAGTRVTQSLLPQTAAATANLLSYRTTPLADTKQSSFTSSSLLSAQSSALDSGTKTDTISKSISKLGTVQETVMQQPSPVPSFSFFPRPRTTPRPTLGSKLKIPMFKFPKFSGTASRPKTQGYIPQAKSGSKWISLSKAPLTRTAALSRGARAVDNTTSSQFRIVKRKGKVVSSMDNYFGANQYKFRPYKIQKGKGVAMTNQYIEKRSARIDTPGEKRGLKVAKWKKQTGGNWLV